MLTGMTPKLISLRALAQQTGLFAEYLKREADAGRIPCIRAGRRRMFDLEAVLRELAARAEREVNRGK